MAAEWIDPKHVDVLDAYRAAQGEHARVRPFGRWFKRNRWYDGFVMVAAPTGEVFTAADGRPSEEPEQS